MPGDAYVLPTRKLGRKGGTTQAGGRGAGAKRLRCSGAQPTPTTLGAPSYIAISADLLYFYICCTAVLEFKNLFDPGMTLFRLPTGGFSWS